MEALIYQQRGLNDNTLDSFKDLFPKSSMLNVNKDNVEAVLKRIKNPPIFTDEWVLFISPYRFPAGSYVDLYAEGLNFLIVVCTSKNSVEEVAITFESEGIDFKFMDGYLPSKESLKAQLMEDLDISDRMATYLGERANWNQDYISGAMEYLKSLKKITKKEINYIIPLKPNATMDDVFEKFIGFPTQKEERALYAVVERYRSSPKFLFTFMEDRLELLLWIYSNVVSGYLSLANAKDFRIQNIKTIREFGKYSSIDLYRFQTLVKCHNITSFDKVYYLKSVLAVVKEKHFSLEGFLYLLEVGD